MTLSIGSLSIGYPGRSLYAQLDLTADSGSFSCVLGRNGAGKTTLLRTIAGLLNPLSGSVRVNGADVHGLTAAERARQIAVVLTERPSAPGLTTYDVVALGRQPYTGWFGQLSPDDRSVIARCLRETGVEALADRAFMTLSDGERQRVLIARALAQEPSLLILDEVTAFLDLPGRVEVMTLLRSVARQRKITVLLSSHDLDLAIQFADCLWVLETGGSLVSGAPEDVVLQGAINRGFDSALARFSLDQATFEGVEGTEGPVIALTGQNPCRYWMARALRRSGFLVVSSDQSNVAASVQVECDPLRLAVSVRGKEAEVNTVGQVLELLSELTL